MIKLALLLRHPAPEATLDPALRAALERCGLIVTGCGRASVSVEASPAVCTALFGTLPQANCPLPIPPSLARTIRLITLAPRPAPTPLTE